MRLRRGAVADLLKGLSFRLQLPGKKWKKVIGTDKIGASFGIEIRNGMEAHLSRWSYINNKQKNHALSVVKGIKLCV